MGLLRPSRKEMENAIVERAYDEATGYYRWKIMLALVIAGLLVINHFFPGSIWAALETFYRIGQYMQQIIGTR